MAITVTSILSERVFADHVELVGGRRGVGRQVHSISVMEVPDFPDGDIGQGMMVLTTLFAYKNDVSAMTEAFEKLVAKGISALVVKLNRLNRYIDTIPAEMVEYADLKGIPLFTITKTNVPFRELIFCVTQCLVNEKYSTLLRINKSYEDLCEALVRREGLPQFLNRFSDAIRLDCVCVSSSGDILSYGGERGSFSPELVHEILENCQEYSPTELKSRPVSCSGYVIYPAVIQNGICGYFIVKADRKFAEEDVFLCRQMVSFLSIKILENFLLLENEQRTSAITIDRILYGSIKDPEGIELSMESIGFVHRGLLRVLLIRNTSLGSGDAFDASHYAQFERFQSYFKQHFPGSVVSSFASGYVVFLALRQDMKPDVLKRKLNSSPDIARILEDFRFGVGRVIDKASEISVSFSGARDAIRFGGIFDPDNRIHFHSEFLEVSAVSNLLGTGEHEDIRTNIIDRIKRYDAAHRSDLWKSLDACISGKSLKQASESLSIHITTLRYRLNKIEEITGVEYFKSSGRYLLQTALIIDKIQ